MDESKKEELKAQVSETVISGVQSGVTQVTSKLEEKKNSETSFVKKCLWSAALILTAGIGTFVTTHGQEIIDKIFSFITNLF